MKKYKIAFIAIVALILLFVKNRKNKQTATSWQWPVPFLAITSDFGNRTHPITGKLTFHNGVDLKAAIGTPIFAPADGVVTGRNYHTAGGNQLVIQHDSYLTGYAHLSKYNVVLGQKIAAGQLIGYTGDTGQVTGPHLHLTVTDRLTNIKIDPKKIFA
jgi:murein DD-endopeptidase MepM/ murein hydrolase activator NlpD